MAMQLTAVSIFLLATGASGVSFRGGFATGMQPDIAARSFAALEDKWSFEAQQLLECQANKAADCEGTEAFQRSCGVVSKAVVQGSSGDKQAVAEYMGTVCGQSTLQGWKGEDCRNFAQSVDASMSDDQYVNREELNVTKLCGNFWQKLSAREEKRTQAARAARAADSAEAARLAAEEAKKVAELRAKEAEAGSAATAKAAAATAETARVQAEEAKKRAEEALREVDAKKDEAAKDVAAVKARSVTGVPSANSTNATNVKTAASFKTAANATGVPTATRAVNATGVPAAANATK